LQPASKAVDRQVTWPASKQNIEVWHASAKRIYVMLKDYRLLKDELVYHRTKVVLIRLLYFQRDSLYLIWAISLNESQESEREWPPSCFVWQKYFNPIVNPYNCESFVNETAAVPGSFCNTHSAL